MLSTCLLSFFLFYQGLLCFMHQPEISALFGFPSLTMTSRVIRDPTGFQAGALPFLWGMGCGCREFPSCRALYHWELVQPWRKAHSMFGSIVLSKNVVLPWCLSSPPVWSAGKCVSLRFVNPLVPYWLESSRCCPKFPSIYIYMVIYEGFHKWGYPK